jgi:pilus assembly protein CpaE
MALPLRVCLYSQADQTDEPFRAPFAQLSDVRIVAECPDWQHLQEFLHCGGFDVVIVSLDSVPDNGSSLLVQRIAEVAPECAIIGVSQNTHSDAIIAAMRAGCNQFVRSPIDPEDLHSALNRVKQTHVPVVEGCQRICVVGASGGTGATTVACNLAMELAHVTQCRCALVDMNLQFGDVACSFDVTPRYTIADVCGNASQIDRTLLESALEAVPCEVSILARPEKVEMAEEVTPVAVDEMFRVMAQMFPFVVVDLPRHFSPAATATLAGADRVLIVSQLTVPHLRNTTRIYEHLVQLGANEEHIEIVLNRCNANFERIKPKEVEKHFGRPVFAVIPNDYKRIGASRDLGHPIMTDSPTSPARLAIQDMARRLATEYLGEENLRPGNKKRFGLFSKHGNRAAPVN